MKYSIVLVSFPFDDLSGTKVRPALCLTNEIGKYKHILIAFVTSNVLKANEPSDLIIESDTGIFEQTGLKVTSAIRLHRMVTIPTWLIQRKLGSLPDPYQPQIIKKLTSLFEL